MKDTLQKHWWQLDLLNLTACLMVVFFHCNTIFYKYSDTMRWKISAAERCVVFAAVPVFFMLSGAHLLDYRRKYDTKTFLKKRLLRVGVPFLFWNCFYILYRTAECHGFPYKSPRAFLSAWLQSDFQVRYWFFFPLFALYACMPILSLLTKHRKIMWYAVIAAFSVSFVLRPLCAICGVQMLSYIEFPAAGGFIAYALFGYLVNTKQWKRRSRWILYAATVCSEVFVILFTCIISGKAHKTVQYMVDYQCFPAALMGASIFVFIRHLPEDGAPLWFQKLLHLCAGCNMGVWLTHSLCMTVVLHFLPLPESSYVWCFAMPFVIYVLCAAGTFVAKKIPLLKHIV